MKAIVRLSIELEGEGDIRESLQSNLRDVLLALSGGSLQSESVPALEAGLVTEATPRRRGRRPKIDVAAANGNVKSGKKRVPRGQGVTATVKNLVGTGYFSDARSASDVISTLSDQGQLSDSKQVYAALKYLTERNMLAREADGDNYRYRITNGDTSEY